MTPCSDREKQRVHDVQTGPQAETHAERILWAPTWSLNQKPEPAQVSKKGSPRSSIMWHWCWAISGLRKVPPDGRAEFPALGTGIEEGIGVGKEEESQGQEIHAIFSFFSADYVQ